MMFRVTDVNIFFSKIHRHPYLIVDAIHVSCFIIACGLMKMRFLLAQWANFDWVRSLS